VLLLRFLGDYFYLTSPSPIGPAADLRATTFLSSC
jgi:hypothetical protein